MIRAATGCASGWESIGIFSTTPRKSPFYRWGFVIRGRGNRAICRPGRNAPKPGDLPPRPECAEAWREKLLAGLPKVQLTLVIGQYAHRYHLAGRQSKTLTDTVKGWREFAPEGLVPLPHPSPRNNIWLKKNEWFEKDVLPALRTQIKKLIRK
jgi:uracil-DNA glycosylase